MRRSRAVIAELRAAELNSRLGRQELETQLAREQAARESFALELGRVRGSVPTTVASEPTLTLCISNGHPSPRTSGSHGRSACTRADRSCFACWCRRAALVLLIVMPSPSGPGQRENVVWSRSDRRSSVIDGKTAVIARLTGDVFSPVRTVRLTNSPDDSPPAMSRSTRLPWGSRVRGSDPDVAPWHSWHPSPPSA